MQSLYNPPNELLTTHINADFDALAAVVAAQRLHPEAKIFFPCSPDTAADVPVRGGLVDPGVGSTSTILVEEMRRRGLECGSTEATLLLLGIYEDTGSLTHTTTVPRDFEAVLWLLARGGDLAAVRRWATRPLDAQHLEILHRMMQRLEVHRLRGHRVGVVDLDLGGTWRSWPPSSPAAWRSSSCRSSSLCLEKGTRTTG